jgi:hypothetical protein
VKGKASLLRLRNNKDARVSKASSAADAHVESNRGTAPRYGQRKSQADDNSDRRTNSSRASSSTTVTKNGVRVSHSVQANGDETVTTLEVKDRTREVTVRESSDGPIEVRIHGRKKNADGSTDEKVYTARDRDELREQSPKIVRMIKRYEKIAGDANASVHVGGATAISKSKSTDGSEIDGDAPALMKKQLAKMLEQNADNPQIQEMIRKMIDDLNRQ